MEKKKKKENTMYYTVENTISQIQLPKDTGPLPLK